MTIEQLKEEIRAKIKTNGQRQISGGITQGVLLDMADTLSELPSLDGFALYSPYVQDIDNLPSAPETGKYFIFVDRQNHTRKYRYIYTCDSSDWEQAFQLWRADMASDESSQVGDVPSLASSAFVRQSLSSMRLPETLAYTSEGSGATWDDFCTATDPISQEAGDQDHIQNIVEGNVGNNARLSSGGGDYYYLTSQSGNWSGNWSLVFGNSADGGYVLEYDGLDYSLTAL